MAYLYFRIKDYKCFREFGLDLEQLTQHGRAVAVRGANGAGKTSLIGALAALRDGIKPHQIRLDAERAEIYFGAGGFDIRRTATRTRNLLEVRRMGEKLDRPAEQITNILHAFGFRPRSFVGQKTQTEQLLRYLGATLPEDVKVPEGLELDRQNLIECCRQLEKVYYALRKSANDEARSQDVVITGLREAIPEGWEPRGHDIDAARSQLQKIEAQLTEVAAWRARQSDRDMARQKSEQRLTDLRRELQAIPSADQIRERVAAERDRQVADIDRQIAVLQEKREHRIAYWNDRSRNAIETYTTDHQRISAEIQKLEKEIATQESPTPHDEAVLQERKAGTEAILREADEDHRYLQLQARIQDALTNKGRHEDVAADHDAALQEIRQLPRNVLAESDLPSEWGNVGLNDRYELTLDGVPLYEVEESRQELFFVDVVAWVQEAGAYPLKVIAVDGLGALGAQRRQKMLEKLDALASRGYFVIYTEIEDGAGALEVG